MKTGEMERSDMIGDPERGINYFLSAAMIARRRATETAPIAYPFPREREYWPVVTYPMMALSPAIMEDNYCETIKELSVRRFAHAPRRRHRPRCRHFSSSLAFV